jgi:hypothetical protein
MLDPRRVIHREIHPQASNASPDLKRTPTDGLSTPPVPPEFHYITTCSVSGRLMKDNIFETISPNEALEIIRRLAKTDKVLKEKIVELAENLIRAVDVDEVCECVFDALDCIDVHELWDRAGPNRDGYTSPEEMSFEMFEEAIAPYIKEMHRLFDLKMHREAKLYCMGILKGIYQYEADSGSKFKDWATDIPGETFGSILRSWGKNSKIKDKNEMKNYIHEECPDWFEWAIKQI